MEELFHAIIWVLAHWRLALSVVGSATITLALSNMFMEFTAGYCITVVIFSAAFGIYWQGRSDVGVGIRTRVPEPKISRPVAFLGLSFVGLIWGGLVTELWKSAFLAVLSLILSVAVVGLWFGMVLRKPIPLQTLAFSAGALISGFLAVLILAHFNA